MMKIKKFGFIAGNFDVIHPGYVKMFKDAKNVCDWLIVALHDDPSLEREHKLKPVLSVDERIEILKILEPVDEVIPYQTESDLYELLQRVSPDIRILGDDYVDKDYTGKDLDIPVYFHKRCRKWSTTLFKKKIAESF
jgi:glycerol-3-phosphate cytidylyltransferase